MFDTMTVELRGEIDILTAAPISARIDALTTHPSPDLVLDLRPVTFIDCYGLSLLCRARNRVLRRGGRLRLVVDSPHVMWILRLARLAETFEVHAVHPARGRKTVDGAPVSSPLRHNDHWARRMVQRRVIDQP